MAKRFRYAFTRKKEARNGVWSVIMAGLSVFCFLASVVCAYCMGESRSYVAGTFALAGVLCSAYGFLLGLTSFAQKDAGHTSSIAGSIGNGIIAVIWLWLYMSGMSAV
ncbi:MAG: hypothetical protein IJ899_15490 [Blautia sp.]|nr:hypothetical protein [Blautia sp.]